MNITKNKFLLLIFILGLIISSCTTAKEANTDPWYQKGPLYIWNSGTSTYDLITPGGSGGVNIIWKGTLSSAPGSPVDGWAYKNSTDGKSYLRYNGAWAEMNQDGATGATGATGPKGDQGDQGIQGIPGNNGSNGINGATWYNGTGAPSSGTGVDGDFYLDNTNPNNVYKKITGSWTLQTNIQGNTGATGSQGIQGIQGIQGNPGSNGTNGTNGVDGKTVLNGSGAPSGGLGVDGDFYIDNTAHSIYGPKTSGTWGSATSLIGPTGSTGATGAKGDKGDTGNTGATGAAGPNTVTGSTTTTLTGILTGNGANVDSVANTLHTQGTDTTMGTTTANIAIGSGYNVDFINALTTDHTWSGLTSTFTAGENLALADVVYINSTTGKVKKALSTGTATMPAVAISTGTINTDAAGSFLLYGFFRDDSWNWAIGGYIYVSKDTAGLLTQTQPTGSGKQVQIVAIALTSKIIFWNPQWVIVGLK